MNTKHTQITYHDLGADWCFTGPDDTALSLLAPDRKPSTEFSGLIVRACNAHADLVAALEGALAYIGDDSRSERRRIENMDWIEAVLAKAKGE